MTLKPSSEIRLVIYRILAQWCRGQVLTCKTEGRRFDSWLDVCECLLLRSSIQKRNDWPMLLSFHWLSNLDRLVILVKSSNFYNLVMINFKQFCSDNWFLLVHILKVEFRYISYICR